MDGARLAAALVAQDKGGFAGIGAELHVAGDVAGDMAGERGLAGSGIAEQAEDLRRSRFGDPVRHRAQRLFLLRRPVHAEISDNKRRTFSERFGKKRGRRGKKSARAAQPKASTGVYQCGEAYASSFRSDNIGSETRFSV